MSMTTMSSRAFNQGASAAKKAAARGPVVITERGKPAHVLLTFEAYQDLIGDRQTIADLLYMPGIADIDLDIPPRDDRGRPADFS